MSMSSRRPVTAAVALLIAVSAGLSLPAAAQAQPVGSGSFTIIGDPGDYVSGGQTWQYSTAAGDALTVSASDDHRGIYLGISGHQGDWWYLNLQAPAGRELSPGSYPDAAEYPFNGTGAGINLYGEGRSCSEANGSFIVDEAVFGPHGYVQTLHASYEQHCEANVAASRGRLTIDNPPAPAELAIGVSAAADGTFDHLNGNATVHGVITCNADVPVAVTGTVTQVKRKTIIKGNYRASVDCTVGTEVAWSAEAQPIGTTPFQRGNAEATTTVAATDPAYQVPVSKSVTSTVNLSRA